MRCGVIHNCIGTETALLHESQWWDIEGSSVQLKACFQQLLRSVEKTFKTLFHELIFFTYSQIA